MLVLKGNSKELLDIKLSEIINLIRDRDKYLWKLVWFEGFGLKNKKFLDIEDTTNNSPIGIFITPKELFDLDKSFNQITEIIIIGLKDSNINSYEDDDLKKECDFFLELVDSSYWEITSKDNSFIENVKREFIYEEID